MVPDDGPEFDGRLTLVMQIMLRVIKDQADTMEAKEQIAGDWQRRAVLGAATIANDLGLRMLEAEARERRLRARLTELVLQWERSPADLHVSLARILADDGRG